ncbi:MAG: HAD family hydrolase [Clostridia bacterium]|nr:HAD family hydrolase [Clostridia bacterium]
MQFKAVIFDLDGTIINSLEDLCDSVNYVLENHGFKTHTLDFIRMTIGNGMRNLIRDSLPAECRADDNLVDQYTSELKEYYLSHWNVKTRPYEGMEELFSYLNQNNIPLCVLSNKADKYTNIIVNHYFSDFKFTAVCGEKPGIPIKPDPAAALAIAKDLGVNSSEILFLGDSAQDIITAKNAGMFAAGALWGFRDEKTLLRAGADSIFEKPVDLIPFLENNK